MKRLLKAHLLILPILAVGVNFSPSTSAESANLTQEKRQTIVQTCVSAQTLLQRIQHNDAATRVNRGQGYETIVSRLISPFNSRTTSQGHNTTAELLIGSTDHYQKTLENFKVHYQEYDNSISAALKTRCQKQPEKFYEYLELARAQRMIVANDIDSLANNITQYRLTVNKLRSEVE